MSDIFERLIHYVVFHQISKSIHSFLNVNEVNPYWQKLHYEKIRYDLVPPIDFKFFSQPTILGTDIKYFEFVDGEGQIKHVQSDETIKDQFIPQELSYLFDEEVIKGSICLILSANHAIVVIYDEELWGLYDPNYSHHSVLRLNKFFNNKNELAKEVIRILGKDLTINLVSLKKENKSELLNWKSRFEAFQWDLICTHEKMLKMIDNKLDYFVTLLKGDEDITGLTVIEIFIFYFPAYLEQLLYDAGKYEKTVLLIRKLLHACSKYFYNFIIEKPQLLLFLLSFYEEKELILFSNFLFSVNGGSETALEVFQRENARGLTTLLQIIKQSPDTSKAFFSQILLRNMEDMDFFKWSVVLDKRNFSGMLGIIENASGGTAWLAEQLFRRKINTGEVGMQIFWENGGKRNLPFLLTIIDKANNEASAAALFFTLKSFIKKTNQTVLRYLIDDFEFSEQYFSSMLKIISKSKDQLDLFYQWLVSPNQEGLTPIEEIFFLKPMCLKYIFSIRKDLQVPLSVDDLEKISRLINKLMAINEQVMVKRKKESTLLTINDLLFFKGEPSQRSHEYREENKRLSLKPT